jgi:predicted  nucleic acid-binding Zn-ribbon protein
LKDQLELLEDLQKHDARLREAEGQLKALPEKLRAMQSDLAKVEAMLDRERAQLSDGEKWKREQDGQLKDSEQSIAKAKSKLQQVKGGKDYLAAQREVESMRKQTSDKEEELLKMMEVIEQGKKSVAAHEGEVATLRASVAREEEAIKGRLVELEAQVKTLRTEREVVAARVRPDVMRRYASITMKKGLAVVPVRRGVCGGCNMAIPPQLFNIIQRNISIETCPTCNRIIYWHEEPKAPDPAS